MWTDSQARYFIDDFSWNEGIWSEDGSKWEEKFDPVHWHAADMSHSGMRRPRPWIATNLLRSHTAGSSHTWNVMIWASDGKATFNARTKKDWATHECPNLSIVWHPSFDTLTQQDRAAHECQDLDIRWLECWTWGRHGSVEVCIFRAELHCTQGEKVRFAARFVIGMETALQAS